MVGLSLSFGAGPALADNLESSHNTYCVRLQQVATLVRSDSRLDDGMRSGFLMEVERICESPLSIFNNAPVDPEGRHKASACYLSLAMLPTDDVTAMDMITPECDQFFSHIYG